MKYLVAIPSKGRAGQVTTHKLFKESTIFCPVSEVEDYKKYHKNVIGIPDDIRGITNSRNWMLDNIDDVWHIQVDDDAIDFYIHENGTTEHTTDIERIDHLVGGMFQLTNDWGFKAFGLALASDPKFYRDYSPFSTLSVIGANMLGVIKNPIRFDAKLKVKEDYDYSLQHMHKYRGVLRLNKYGINVVHLTNTGGVVAYRTKETEMEAYRILLEKWGSRVVKYSGNKNFVKISVPLKGI